jgi:pyruvate dehydrogenase E2 component (dihydrolipoyllysine-residue acetyltransferase)
VSAGVLRMPRLSDSMSEATIVAWLKQPGEAFVRGEPLVEVETDKATVVYEAEADGLLAEILVSEGATASLGEPIARLGREGGGDEPQTTIVEPAAAVESRPAVDSVQRLVEPRAPAAAHLAPAHPAPAHPAPEARAKATPVARRTAVQLGVALHGLTGTGPGGRIRRMDVVRAERSARPSETNDLKGPTTVVPLSTTGETIARRMTQSRSEIPSFEVVVQADMTTIVGLRKDAADLVETVPSVNDFVVKAVAAALREYPAFNSSFIDGRCERHGRVNVGVAVATDDALLVPAVMDADVKPLAVIAGETRDLVAQARARRLTPETLTASTFTVSNLGMFDVRSFTAVINPPQVAILAVGAVARTPAETAMGGVTFRDVATLTLTSDHRAVYGADAARFLGRIRQLLEHPLALVL